MKVNFNSVSYQLIEFHFHSPSEHYYKGKQYAAEAHFVHVDDNDNMFELSAFLDLATPYSAQAGSPVLGQLWSKGLGADKVEVSANPQPFNPCEAFFNIITR